MEKKEYFQTREGEFRILVEQVIDGKAVEWFLIERSKIHAPDRIATHKAAVEEFVGREVEFMISRTDGYNYGFAFDIKQPTDVTKESAA